MIKEQKNDHIFEGLNIDVVTIELTVQLQQNKAPSIGQGIGFIP